MTTKTINGKEILFVQVPENLRGEPYINEYRNLICFTEKPLCYPTAIKLPDGEWSIIGLASNLTEDEWKEIVEKEPQSEYDFPSVLIYKTYRGRMPYSTAAQSGQSLLQSLNLNLETTLLILKR